MRSTIKLTCLISSVIFLLVGFGGVCDGARGGGGRGGGGRSSGSRSSSRSSSGHSSSTRVNIRVSSHSRRPWGSGSQYRSWRSYGSSGYIYGYVYYTRTRHYHDNPDREPQICYNEYDYHEMNGTTYSLFICPGAYQSEDYNYCCGDEDRQTCCRFWDSGLRVTGVIAGLLMFTILACLSVYCCCFHRSQPTVQPFFQSRVLSRRTNTRSQNVHYTVASTGPPATVVSCPLTGPTATYPQSEQQPLFPIQPATNVCYPADQTYRAVDTGSKDTGFVPISDPIYPQYPQAGSDPSYPQYPQAAGDPSYPQYPQAASDPNYPQYPQAAGDPSYPQYPQAASDPNYPQYPAPSGGYPPAAISPPPPYPASPYPVCQPSPYLATGYQSAGYPVNPSVYQSNSTASTHPSAPPTEQGVGVPPYSASPAPSYSR